MDEQSIVTDPMVLMGKPVVAGTRITVELILEKLAAGETIEQIVEAHPRLSERGVRAALRFAADALRAEVVHPIPEVRG
jgi:uncharacterized protein (DUF433 family)